MNKLRYKNLGRTIGASIAEMRDRAGMTQEEVAERLGIGLEAISRIERGIVSPNYQRMVEFCEIFECKFSDLARSGSDRPSDQHDSMLSLVSNLSAPDREAIVEVVARLASHMAKRGKR